MTTDELAKLINSRLDRVDSKLGDVDTRLHGLEKSHAVHVAESGSFRDKVDELDKRVDKVEAVVERGKGARWLMGIVVVLLAIANGWRRLFGD